MKTLNIDFSTDRLGTIAREGEHNRTQLVFALDEGLRDCDFINVEFGIAGSGDKLVLENLCPEEGESTLSVSLTQDVTVSGALAIQLIGYVVDSETAEPQIIAKSPVVSGVVTPSINGIKKITQGTAELLDRILAKVHALSEKIHEHGNKKTLDLFSCPAVETGFAQDASSEDLKWRGRIVAFDDGNTATISDVKEVEKNGQLFLRLSLFQGNVVYKKLPDYIDIPISESNDVSEELAPGLTLNGSELDFGTGETNEEISTLKTTLGEVQNDVAALEENQHEHGNKDVLDSVTFDSLLTDAQRSAIENDTVPFVTELPTDAKVGDICRYARANNLSIEDTGKTIYFSDKWLSQTYSADELPQSRSCNLTGDVGVQFFVDYRIFGDNVLGINIFTYNFGYKIFYRLGTDGTFSLVNDNPNYESCYQDGNGKRSITELPKTLQIPQDVYITAHNDELPFTLFYHEPKLMIYLDEWVEFPSKAELEGLEDTVLNNHDALDGRVSTLEESSHTHTNADILNTVTADMLLTEEQSSAIAGISGLEARITALETDLSGANATADEILETIGGEE